MNLNGEIMAERLQWSKDVCISEKVSLSWVRVLLKMDDKFEEGVHRIWLKQERLVYVSSRIDMIAC
jgi:hypothetical protein